MNNNIALLATGDEILHGDILNSNAQEISARLFQRGITVSTHMTVGDTIQDIELAIHSLLSHHRALIITGGLGPTSDDLTRYALSNALKRSLIFSESVWKAICDRLALFGYHIPPESNKQQALFPEGGNVILNPHGTAAGWEIQLDNQQWIFMLPGPPAECLSMIDTHVLPTLLQHQFQQITFHRKWLLFGVSEGKIAEELDELTKSYSCTTGYRLCYPYLEFKIHCQDKNIFDALIILIEKTITPYMIGDGQQTASEILIKQLQTSKQILAIDDQATGGFLESLIKTPDTLSHLHFSHHLNNFPAATLRIEVRGLNELWQKIPVHQTTIEMTLTDGNHSESIKAEIPFRSSSVKQYAAEWVCGKVLLKYTNRGSNENTTNIL